MHLERALNLARLAVESTEPGEKANAAAALGKLVQAEPEILLELERRAKERDEPPPPPKPRKKRSPSESGKRSFDDLIDDFLKRNMPGFWPDEAYAGYTRVEVRPSPPQGTVVQSGNLRLGGGSLKGTRVRIIRQP